MKMTSFFDFDKVFEDLNEIMKKMREKKIFEKATNEGNINGKWDVKEIDQNGIRGYIIRGSFWSDDPFGPFNPTEPLEPQERRPLPRKPFRTNEVREPLVDIFEEDQEIKIYVELPGEEKKDIKLNYTENEVEVKAKNFYKMINVPDSANPKKTSPKYNNGVLILTIPKKQPAKKQ